MDREVSVVLSAYVASNYYGFWTLALKLQCRRLTAAAGYFDGDNYIQHNPQVPDKLSGLGATLEALGKQGIFLRYDKVHKVLGEGNFVLVVSEGHFGKDYNQLYDLFKVENGKIAEHWDVIEPIPAKRIEKTQMVNFNTEIRIRISKIVLIFRTILLFYISI